jgi:hypothetical protein
MVVLRLQAGRRRKADKADKGGYAFGGPPYGYRAEGRALVPHEAEQAALARMTELRSGGASLRAVASALRRPRDTDLDGQPGAAWRRWRRYSRESPRDRDPTFIPHDCRRGTSSQVHPACNRTSWQ